MLSNSSKYALKAVLYLAVNSSGGGKILAKTLSARTNVPSAYLSKLLQELSKHNIVSSTKGPNGGFYLTDENRAVHLLKIIDVIDGDNRLNSCMLSLNKCDMSHPCPMHEIFGKSKAHFVKTLEETTVEDMVADVRSGKAFLPI